jgi:hypothetical protein
LRPDGVLNPGRTEINRSFTNDEFYWYAFGRTCVKLTAAAGCNRALYWYAIIANTEGAKVVSVSDLDPEKLAPVEQGQRDARVSRPPNRMRKNLETGSKVPATYSAVIPAKGAHGVTPATDLRRAKPGGGGMATVLIPWHNFTPTVERVPRYSDVAFLLASVRFCEPSRM